MAYENGYNCCQAAICKDGHVGLDKAGYGHAHGSPPTWTLKRAQSLTCCMYRRSPAGRRSTCRGAMRRTQHQPAAVLYPSVCSLRTGWWWRLCTRSSWRRSPSGWGGKERLLRKKNNCSCRTTPVSASLGWLPVSSWVLMRIYMAGHHTTSLNSSLSKKASQICWVRPANQRCAMCRKSI